MTDLLLDASQIRDRIIRAAQLFTGNAELEDDRTLMVLRYTGVATGERLLLEASHA